MILMDTNVCIRILRGRKDAVRAFSENAGDVAVPFMALGELYYGAARSKDPAATLRQWSSERLRWQIILHRFPFP